ncbi:MAG TPA: TIGR04283 family arsenosugar biosynthesis glycosyltransferase [Desulfobacterales bacterium]|nr:TIGR04283 family arsenosugar biosynthesis glycosyltransferase [Desulfobacterales bacterium]
MKKKLIVFTRYPETGTTKTRLIPVLGAKGSADLHRKMTEHTLAQLKRLSTSNALTIEICYDGGNEHLMKNWLGPDLDYQPQGIGHLGLRMKRAFEDAFRSGADAAVLIGTDIPDITDTVIQTAFDTLKQKNMVIGPAKDGGYYLIGLQSASLSSAMDHLFSGITWGRRDVLRKTLDVAKGLGLSFSLVDELEDVDQPEDLSIWKRSQILNHHDFIPGNISVIIPALNEADNIAETLLSIGHENNIQVIVADGGSRDNTVSIAQSLGAKVINVLPPRSKQMNRGAAEATGDVLLFLHADTRLPKSFDRLVLRSLARPGIAAGAFELRIDAPTPALRLIERIANWRSRCLRTPYGDQAIFMLSRVFHAAGGFSDFPIMEDFELIRRLRKKGEIITVSASVLTSSRRWQNFGILKTTLINQLIIIAYYMGIPPDTIARLYRRRKGISSIF